MGKPTSKESEFYSVVLPTTSKAWFGSLGVEAWVSGLDCSAEWMEES